MNGFQSCVGVKYTFYTARDRKKSTYIEIATVLAVIAFNVLSD